MNRHTLLTALLLVAMLAIVVFPWRGSLSLPAVLQAGEFRTVYATEQGRVLEVLVNQLDEVRQGAPLIRLEQPELEHALIQTRRELGLVEERIARQVGSTRDLQDAMVLTQQRLELLTRLDSLLERRARLNLIAPIAGRISHVERLQPGQWVSQSAPLLTVRSAQGLRVMALVSAEELHRLEQGASAVWISDLAGAARLELKLMRIDYAALQTLPWPELASDFGGPVPTRKVQQSLRLEGAWYQVELVPLDENRAPSLQQTGRVLVEAKPESLAGRYWRHAAAVWIRESGF